MSKRRSEKMMQNAAVLIADQDRPGFETANIERVAKAGPGGVETTPPSPKAPKGTQRIIAAPLDRLWKAGIITQNEFEAGEKYRADAYLAAIDPSAGTIDWNRAGGGGASSRVPSMFNSQVIADARHRVRDTERALNELVRTVLNKALIREHTFEEIGQSMFGLGNHRDAYVGGNVAVRVALSVAAMHYGM